MGKYTKDLKKQIEKLENRVGDLEGEIEEIKEYLKRTRKRLW